MHVKINIHRVPFFSLFKLVYDITNYWHRSRTGYLRQSSQLLAICRKVDIS